jgi:hypothetical protein
MTGLCWPEAPR